MGHNIPNLPSSFLSPQRFYQNFEKASESTVSAATRPKIKAQTHSKLDAQSGFAASETRSLTIET